MIRKILLTAIVSTLVLTACNNDDSKKTETQKKEVAFFAPDSTVIKEGKSIAMGTFKILGGRLKSAIKKGGPVAGIDVCSSQAMELTDSISKAYNISLKRVSLKNRNEVNIPNGSEKEILESWEKSIKEGNSIKPRILRSENSEITFVAPIKIKHQCIVCHGSDDFVSSDVRLKLKEHYPNDKARNYNEGDLRGAWVITFPKGYFEK